MNELHYISVNIVFDNQDEHLKVHSRNSNAVSSGGNTWK